MAWTDLLAASWAQLNTGDIFGAVLGSYTNVMGYWFYAIVMMMGMSMIYIKTQNFGTVTVTGMIISAAAIPFMPTDTLGLIFVFLALGITFVMYRAFHT